MKKILLLLIVILLSGMLHAQSGGPKTRILVQFKPEVTSANPWEKDHTLMKCFHDNSLESSRISGSMKNRAYQYYVLEFGSHLKINELLETIQQSPLVLFAEADQIGAATGVQLVVPDDQFYPNQWGLKNNGTFSLSPAVAGADIDMENGWNIEQGDTNIVLGVIDSGTKLDHPEFTGRLWRNYGEIAGNGADDDNNGFIDDINGWDFANNDNNPFDDNGHGTNVAGIACATGNNSIGYAGVDWNCKLMTMKGLDASSFGFYSWWADAIYYAVDNGVNVLNMSLGGTGSSATLQTAVNYALTNNVTVVVSMGNANSASVSYPAVYAGVIAVGSTDPDDTRTVPFFWSSTSGSNFGSHISVVAPGNYMYGLSYTSNTSYSSYWGGTSQATPLVSGLATLLLAQNPLLAPAQIKSVIEATAEDQVGDVSEDVAGWDQYYGYGRVNANYALSVMTGLQTNENEAAFSVYPNPIKIVAGHAAFTVSFPENTGSIYLYNATGQLLQTHAVTDLHLKQLYAEIPGIYFVRIITTTGTVTKKIIVVR